MDPFGLHVRDFVALGEPSFAQQFTSGVFLDKRGTLIWISPLTLEIFSSMTMS
jgi:hypothetical protein